MISVLAGVGEEVLFRGAMQPEWGLIATSLIFGLFHIGGRLTMALGIWAACTGALLGWLTIATGGLLAPIVAHITYDALALSYLRWGPDRAPGLKRRQDVRLTRLIAAIVACLGITSIAAAQQRPLVTEDPETIGAGRVLVEFGVDHTKDQHFPVSGLTGDLWTVPNIGFSFGISSIAEIQIDGAPYQRLDITRREDAPLAGASRRAATSPKASATSSSAPSCA